MKILMANDDGIESDGIVLLAERLCEVGHEVLVCAPIHNQSAMSHSITIRNAYYYEKREYTDRKATYYGVDGKPVDCVQFGLNYLHFQPDLIISGINNDKNLGSDSIYSGTVGAACDGAFYNIKSWALSVYYGMTKQPSCVFDKVIDYVVEHFDELYAMSSTEYFLNINVPIIMPIVGRKVCPLAKCKYDMSFIDLGNGMVQLNGLPMEYEKAADGTDIYYIQRGYVTVTPLKYEMTDFSALEKINQ